MFVEVIAIFRCSRDAHDAVEALKTDGINTDRVHVGSRGKSVATRAESGGAPVEAHSLEEAEYVAHGEHLGSHFPAAGLLLQEAPQSVRLSRVVVTVRDGGCPLAAMQIVETLCAHGALAARAEKGRWIRSPYRALRHA
ncbi:MULTISPECIES: hypothetical protein [unclassified Caballeronia]|uniref:hypothetical protein n=1 Tax=unclassified Caballeronia TaxID=2646786 RepID=UPI00202999DE|nr:MULTISPECIES: hypothetical protein [unclassified Caballeronia]